MVDDTEQPDQRVVLVRHAQTAWSLSGQHTGTTDLALTDEGRAATRLLAERRMQARIDRVVDELIDACTHGGDVVVFAHGHSLTALTVRWLGLPIATGRHLRLGTGSVSTLGWKRGVRVLELWNDRRHTD